jgi:hypothetical protein
MATQLNSTNLNRFHNLSPAMLADLIGDLDHKAKSATTELDAAKDAFKARGLLIAEGDAHSVMLQKSIRQTTGPFLLQHPRPFDGTCKSARMKFPLG